MDKKGKVYEEIKILTEAHKGFKKTLEKLFCVIRDLMDENVEKIGIGIASPIDYKKGVVIHCPNLPGWKNIPLKKLIEKEFKIKASIKNDATCFVIAEHKFGAANGYKNVVGLTLGTGIGGGIIIDNKLYRGRDNIAGEIGHMAIDFTRYPCPCGSSGCFERFASGTAIRDRTLLHLKKGKYKTCLKAEKLSTRDIYNAALKDKDPLAVHIVEDTGKYIGIGIASIIDILNPEIIVLGGSVSKNYEIFKKNMFKAIKERAFSPGDTVPVVVKKLDYPATIGAALC